MYCFIHAKSVLKRSNRNELGKAEMHVSCISIEGNHKIFRMIMTLLIDLMWEITHMFSYICHLLALHAQYNKRYEVLVFDRLSLSSSRM